MKGEHLSSDEVYESRFTGSIRTDERDALTLVENEIINMENYFSLATNYCVVERNQRSLFNASHAIPSVITSYLYQNSANQDTRLWAITLKERIAP